MGHILQEGRMQHATQKKTIIADTVVIFNLITLHEYFV